MKVPAFEKCIACLSAAVFALECTTTAHADPGTPPRELVYSYTFQSERTDEAERALGLDKMDPGPGGTFMYRRRAGHVNFPSLGTEASKPRSGILKIDVLRQEPDGGVVLSVNEDPSNASSAVTCVAFDDTGVVCDPNREIGPEVPPIVSLFGKNFVDPARLDADRHWRVSPPSSDETTADYRIRKAQGSLLDIEETGVLAKKGSQSKTTIDASIEYDVARSIPISVEESTVRRSQQGIISQTFATRASFTLQSDSGK